ncbi:MAG: flagellar hook-basal body protein [Verrucomicrobiota bacterium]|jgi:flagellar basal body rod protein FlgG|nr:flagellar hook-basal body protein [Verrucomicrobiota bacterium]
MNVTLYQAAAALEGNLLRQQAIAENLSAASVPGFKKNDIGFSAISADMFKGQLDKAQDKSQLQFLFPSFEQQTNFQQGTLISTNVNTDVAIDGPGFFAVQGPNNQIFYTRDGTFRPNQDGLLATKDGYPLLSETGTISVDSTNSEPVTISNSGDVSQGGNGLGRLQIVNFSNPEQLQRASAGYFTAGNQAAQSADLTTTSVRQGFLEGANTTPMNEMSELMQTLRHYEANQRIMQMQDEHLGKLIQELSSLN